MENSSKLILGHLIKLTRLSDKKFKLGNFKGALADKMKANIILQSKSSDKKIIAKVVSLNDNNVHIILNNEFDGVISLNELSWLKKPPHPSKILNLNDDKISVFSMTQSI